LPWRNVQVRRRERRDRQRRERELIEVLQCPRSVEGFTEASEGVVVHAATVSHARRGVKGAITGLDVHLRHRLCAFPC